MMMVAIGEADREEGRGALAMYARRIGPQQKFDSIRCDSERFARAHIRYRSITRSCLCGRVCSRDDVISAPQPQRAIHNLFRG